MGASSFTTFMAKTATQKATPKAATPKKPAARPSGPKPTTTKWRPTLSFSRVNAIWLGAGVISIAIGYALLAAGMTTLPAFLLVVGYLVLLPIGIIKK
jgi:hypothetical protein